MSYVIGTQMRACFTEHKDTDQNCPFQRL